MKRNVIYLYFLVSIALQGCVPMIGTYYAPTGQGGYTVLSDCRGNAGYPSVFKFKHDQLTIEINNLIFEETNELSITVALYVKKNTVVTIKPKKLQIQTDGEIKNYAFENMLAYKFAKAGASDVSEQTAFSGADYDVYHFDSTLQINSDQFVLILPTFYLDQQAIDLGPITYKKKRGWAIFPINC